MAATPQPLDPILIAKKAGEGEVKMVASQDRRAQAAIIMARRLTGETVEDLASSFRLSPRTVKNRLELARKDGVPDAARLIVIEELLPRALAVYQEALESEDLKLALVVANKVVDGLAVLSLPRSEQTGVEETFEAFRARITRRITDPHGSVGTPQPTVEVVPAGDDGAEAVSLRPLAGFIEGVETEDAPPPEDDPPDFSPSGGDPGLPPASPDGAHDYSTPDGH